MSSEKNKCGMKFFSCFSNSALKNILKAAEISEKNLIAGLCNYCVCHIKLYEVSANSLLLLLINFLLKSRKRIHTNDLMKLYLPDHFNHPLLFEDRTIN